MGQDSSTRPGNGPAGSAKNRAGPDKGARSLAGLRVLEFPDPKLSFCGKLLAQMGADVVLVEPPGGSPLRGAPPLTQDGRESLFFWAFNAGKRSVTLDVATAQGKAALLGLVSQADVVLEGFSPGYLDTLGLGAEAMARGNPGLIVCSVTPFGQTGPFKDLQGSNIIAWAMGGLQSLTGEAEGEPLAAPGMQAYHVASMWAAIAIQAAVYRRRRTGQGARIDLSAQEVVLDQSEAAHVFWVGNRKVMRRAGGKHPLACPFSTFQSKDGYAFIGLSSQGQWQALTAWMQEDGMLPPALEDPSLKELANRLARRGEIEAAITAWGKTKTNEVLFNEGAKRGVPNAPVRRMPEVLADEQLREREFFVPMPDPRQGVQRAYAVAGAPFRGRRGPWTGVSAGPPAPGGHAGAVMKDWGAGRKAAAERREPVRGGKPLEGIKVLEFCWNIAGPTVGRILTDLGAEVVKLEPREIGEPMRVMPPWLDEKPNINRCFTFMEMNRDKRSVTLDMKKAEAQEIALRLAGQSDIVLENFTAGTMERLGVPYEKMARRNPRVILGSMCGYGQTGSRRGWPSYHPTSAAMSGLTGLFGYEGGAPQGFGHAHMDFTAGLLGTIAVLDALLRREATGEGDHMDSSQLEAGVALLGPQLLEWQVNGRIAAPEGNRSASLGAALQGCYACAGDDQWIVVTAADEAALAKLAAIVGAKREVTASDTEAALRRWARTRGPWEAFTALQAGGVPAGVVSYGPDLAEGDPHLQARGVWKTVEHPELGRHRMIQCPIVLDGERLSLRGPGPLVGQHTEEVLKDVLQMSDEEYMQRVLEEVV